MAFAGGCYRLEGGGHGKLLFNENRVSAGAGEEGYDGGSLHNSVSALTCD